MCEFFFKDFRITEIIEEEISVHQEVVDKLISVTGASIKKAGSLIIQTLASGNKIIFLGNGGSAADAQHLAAELTGRFRLERKGLPGIAITTDTSVLTAIANDYGYEQVFSRQVESLARAGDLIIGISTSGSSPNVVNALSKAKKMGCHTIGFTGQNFEHIRSFCDVVIAVPSTDTARIQEVHILIGHILCHLVDQSGLGK